LLDRPADTRAARLPRNGAILVAEDLAAGLVLRLGPKAVAGIATDAGGEDPMLLRWLVIGLIVLPGCSRATLPYKPDPQPHGARISADAHELADRLRVEIDTDGRRLEQAWIIKPDGTSVAADAVENPPVVTGPPPSISVGVGGGSYGGGIGVGTGVGAGFPVGEGRSRTQGNTTVWFPAAQAGAAPWRLYVKLAGVEPTTFFVGGPTTP